LFNTSAAAAAAAAAASVFFSWIQWTGAKADFEDLDKIFPDAVLQFVGGGQLKLPAYHCNEIFAC
jgi:hypothetical protein